MKRLPVAAAVLAALLCGCAAQGGPAPGRHAERPMLDNARPAGESEDCVVRRNIGSTVVLDDRTIDFHMRGGRVLRNRLRAACPRLAFEESFSYPAPGGRLCSGDLITVRTSTGAGGGACPLGRFQPVETGSGR